MNDETKEIDLTGIPAQHHEIVKAHGRDAYHLAMIAGLSTEGLTRLDELARKHYSEMGVAAVSVVQIQLNMLLGGMLEAKGLSQEQVRACQRDILSTPIEETRIQLLHQLGNYAWVRIVE